MRCRSPPHPRRERIYAFRNAAPTERMNPFPTVGASIARPLVQGWTAVTDDQWSPLQPLSIHPAPLHKGGHPNAQMERILARISPLRKGFSHSIFDIDWSNPNPCCFGFVSCFARYIGYLYHCNRIDGLGLCLRCSCLVAKRAICGNYLYRSGSIVCCINDLGNHQGILLIPHPPRKNAPPPGCVLFILLPNKRWILRVRSGGRGRPLGQKEGDSLSPSRLPHLLPKSRGRRKHTRSSGETFSPAPLCNRR